jgi:hypothetical protein
MLSKWMLQKPHQNSDTPTWYDTKSKLRSGTKWWQDKFCECLLLLALPWCNSPTRTTTASFFTFLHHTQRHTTVGRLLWTWDRLVAETSTWQHATLTTDRHPCPRRDSNPLSQQASGCRPLVLRPFHTIRHVSVPSQNVTVR